nr:LapA family protein [Shewanella litorisediminis]
MTRVKEAAVKGFFVALVIALLFVLALLLGSRNEQLVTINYFVAQGEFRLPVVLASVFFAGFLLCWCFAVYHIGKLKYALSRANRKLQKLEPQAAAKPAPLVSSGEVKS